MNNPSLEIIGGLGEIADRYDAFILDLFGVIHNGIEPYPGTIECLTRLKDMGKTTCLLSNSPRRAEQAAQQNADMGIPRDLYTDILTSGEATYQSLRAPLNAFGKNCWFIGNDVVTHTLDGLDLVMKNGPEEADFILNSIPGTQETEMDALLESFETALTLKLPMICANPDLVVHIGDRLYKCAGSFAKIYEDRGGHVTYYGKPHQPVYESAWEKLGKPEKSSILAIGDSLHTDIQGANMFGVDSVFNLVGIHWEEVRLDHAPGEADIGKVRQIIVEQPHQPTAVMCGFEW